MLQINNLTKVYGTNTVLNIESLCINEGEAVGLVGNNGAGKTTLFRLILDLILSDNGEVLFQGAPVKGSDDWKSFVGSFLDDSFLIDFLTVKEYFSFVGGLHSMTEDEIKVFVEEMSPLFGFEISLTDNKFIRNYSTGNKKKIGIAAAMMGHPRLLILDEPFTALDPTSQIRLKKILNAKREHEGMTLFISSHDLNHITEVSKRIVILKQGEVIRDMECNQQTLSQLEAYFDD
ncbi:ABC transporter ATP-binding protein [Falsiporphyromonas endometrii]|uniref:ABC transporter ATP-binding protein n=1 Tax=Falsiporphyromonas endometrii TaxID=1387297 RepID=A0ABV9K8X1_9PORP